MRGTETKQATMLSLLSPEQRVPKDHPLREAAYVRVSSKGQDHAMQRHSIRTIDIAAAAGLPGSSGAAGSGAHVRARLTDVRMQAPQPLDNFSATPWPPGPAPYIP